MTATADLAVYSFCLPILPFYADLSFYNALTCLVRSDLSYGENLRTMYFIIWEKQYGKQDVE